MSSLRSQIHGTWEAFFSPTLYLMLFVGVYYSIYAASSFQADLNAATTTLRKFKASEAYSLAKEVELHKALPFVAILLAAAVVYLFDRIVERIGTAIPPHVEWHGTPIIYIRRHLALNLWNLLPDEKDPSALDARARAIIDSARANGQTLPSSTIEYHDRRFSRAASELAKAKAGVLWCAFLLALEMLTRGPSWHVALGVVFLVLFLVLVGINAVRMTWALLQKVEENLYLAAQVLEMERRGRIADRTVGMRNSEFESSMLSVTERAPRYLTFKWRKGRLWEGYLWALVGVPRSPREH